MSLIHRRPSSKSQRVPADSLQNLTPFGPDNPSPAPFLPGHGGLKTGRTYRSGADIVRKFLECRKLSAKDEYGRTRLERMVANMAEIAESPTSPQAVAAFNALMDRAYGKAKLHDDEVDAISKQGGIQIVYVRRVERDPEIPRARALPAPVADFGKEGLGSSQEKP